jgi:hypothetical protein
MRIGRVVIALVLLALAAFAALLAADMRAWQATLRAGDLTYSGSPADAAWTNPSLLPGDPAGSILNLSGQLAYRKASQSFVAVNAAGNGFDNGYTESRERGDLESTFESLARGADRARDAELENMLGILAFADSRQRGPSAPAPVERSVAGFRSAVQLDPSNEDAKFNLESLMRALVAHGSRGGGTSGSGGPARGHKGAGGGIPGRGY